MDDMSTIKFAFDSTFAMLLAAQERGHEVFYYLPSELSYDFTQKKLSANVRKVKLRNDANNYYQIISQKITDLTEFDVVLLRQDPPFNMHYITSTYLLERIADKVLVLNNPAEVRNCPEKLMVSMFPDLMAPTLFSKDLNQIKEFYQTHGDIILKPLYGNGGESIMLIKKGDPNFNSILEVMIGYYDGLILAQKFLPQVSEGDKRIILFDGEVAAKFLRIPKQNEIVSTMVRGGGIRQTELSKRDREICDRLGPELKKRGLFFVGIDVIDGHLTEINVTSPTGFSAAKLIENKELAQEFIMRVEQKIAK